MGRLGDLAYRLRPSKTFGRLAGDVKEYIEGPAYDLNSTFDRRTLRYPMKLEHFVVEVPNYFMPLDAAGVPVADYGSQGPQYVPSRIAGYGLSCWNISIDHPESGRREEFMRCANWFLAQSDGMFRYNFNISDLRTPWISCLGQGEGISMLVRAYRHTGDRRYLDVARRAAAPLLVSEEQGGVQRRLPDGQLFIEEYPRSRQTHVLNGALFGLIGLADLLDVVGDEEPELCKVRGEVAAAIAANLERWSIGGWTLYNIENAPLGLKNGATVYYHLLHIAQIRHMAERFPQHPEFARYAERWSRGLHSLPTRLRAFAAKLTYRAVTGW